MGTTLFLILIINISILHKALAFHFSFPEKEEPIDTSCQGKIIQSITWTGLNTTSPKLFQREFIHQVGDRYQSKILEMEQKRLKFYDHLSSVKTKILTDSDGVHLAWEIEETPPFLITPAWSYYEIDGLSLGFTFYHTNIDGLGGKIGFSSLFGKNNSYEIFFDHPWLTGQHLGLKTKISYSSQKNDLENWKELFYETESWFTGRYGEIGRISFGFGNTNAKITPYFSNHTTDYNIYWLGKRLGIDSRNQLIGTTQGVWTEFQYQYFFGTHFYHKFIYDLRYWYPLSENLYLFQSGIFQSYTKNVHNGLPIYEQFRLGGSNTVRGYQLSTTGKKIFGSNEYLGTTEFRWRFLPPIQFEFSKYKILNRLEFATFFDVGSAWNNSIVHSKRILGGGFGFRIIAPLIYEARLDIAVGENQHHTIHFGLQTKNDWQRKRKR